MTDALRPLRELADDGPAVLILHHPRKGAAAGGQGSRGTGALPAFVDFLISGEVDVFLNPIDGVINRMIFLEHLPEPFIGAPEVFDRVPMLGKLPEDWVMQVHG